MSQILLNEKKFSLLSFTSESEFESAVIENKNQLFGEGAIYIDVKKRQGKNSSYHKGVPDAYLVDFFDPKSPQLYFIENELVSHDIYGHIIEQIARFSAIIISSAPGIRDSLLQHIRENEPVLKVIERKLAQTPYHNLDDLMIFLTEKHDIKIAIVIDEITEDLNLSLKSFKNSPDVASLQRYKCGEEIAYLCEPMRDEVVDVSSNAVQENASDVLDTSRNFDTVVCAAFEEGFKHAYVQNSAWWAIRLSQEAREKIKHLAIYEKSPIAEIKHIADVEKIEPYKDTGKYIVYLKNRREVRPIKLGKFSGAAPQSPRFTTLEKLTHAQKMDQLWG